MTDLSATDRPALMVFSDDWGRHPSSCQHLVRRLLPRYPTWWVNTIGMRRPALDRTTWIRGLQKLAAWTKSGRSSSVGQEAPHVLNPLMWPWFRNRVDRRINRHMLGRQLGRLIKTIDRDVVAITTVPVVADLIGSLPVKRWVYYCVDDFGRWPGLDQQPVEAMETLLVRRADVLIAVSEALQERLAGLGRSSALLTHGVELEHWNPPDESGSSEISSALKAARVRALEALGECRRPLVLFWGVIDRRMDVDFVGRMAEELGSGTILLTGPLSDPDPELLRLPRVRHLPPVPFDVLPHLAREAAVLVMPYADLPVTRMIQPLKLKEYLATGKPVVVRDLPATRSWSDAADVAGSAESFSEAVRRRIASGLPEEQRAARARLDQEGWATKAAQFESIVMGGL